MAIRCIAALDASKRCSVVQGATDTDGTKNVLETCWRESTFTFKGKTVDFDLGTTYMTEFAQKAGSGTS